MSFGKMSGIDCRRFLLSPHPLLMFLIFCTLSRAVSFPSRKFLETPATQASICLIVADKDIFMKN